jgi:rubrerythrin
LAFAARAEKDGYPQIAKLFRAAAEAETVHAHAHLRVMKGVKETADNLKAAIAGEAHEFQEMYPKFIEEAEAEGNQGAVVSFKNAMAVEKIHNQLYQQALSALEGGKDLPETSIHVCEICGNTVQGEAPDRCPICNAPKARFAKVA